MTQRTIRFGKVAPDATVDFAVQELARYLKQMDPKLSVDILQSDCVNDAFKDIIWVGLDPTFASQVPEVKDAAMDDAIVIKIENSCGFITGTNSRSVLLAVYRLLEELGCAWVRPGKEGERIPQKRIENVNVNLTEVASYRHRGLCIEGAASFENIMDMIDFLPKIGMTAYFFEHYEPLTFFERWYEHKRSKYLESKPVSRDEILAMLKVFEQEMARRGILYHKAGHGWNCEPFGMDGTGWGVSDGAGIPEETKPLLAMIGGERKLHRGIPMNTNLCYSNPKVRKTIVDAIVDYSRKNPAVDIIHFWLADGSSNHCECDECRKMTPSDWYVQMLNEIDDAIAEAGLPTRIVFLIYTDLMWAPTKIKPHDSERLILMYAPITRNYGQNYRDYLEYDGELPEFKLNKIQLANSLAVNLAQLREWQKLFDGDSFVYDYHLMYAHFNDPGYELNAKNVFDDMRDLELIGINGMNSCQLTRVFFPTALPMKMMAAALWNKNAEYEPLADKYYLDAFGPDGLQVRSYMKEISNLFNIYEGASHGKGAKLGGGMVKDYAKLTQLVAGFLPIIHEHAAARAVWSEDWQHLIVHAEYVLALADVFKMLDAGDYENAAPAVQEMADILFRNELTVQKVVDPFKARSHWTRRLDPEKVLVTDVM